MIQPDFLQKVEVSVWSSKFGKSKDGVGEQS